MVFDSEFTETEVSPVEYDQSELPVVEIETMPFNSSEADTIDNFVVTKSTWDLPAETTMIQSEFVSPVSEKPLVKSRFANQRKTTKFVTEGKRRRIYIFEFCSLSFLIVLN